MGLLGEIYSFGNRTRNKLRGLLDDPKGYLQQTADQTANTLRDMTGANETAQQFALRDKINAGDKNALEQYRNLEKTIQNKLFDVALNFNPAAVGMFIGKGAKTWDAAAAAKAEKRLSAGDDARKVWSELGVFRGPDGHLRQEIPDNNSAVKEMIPPNFQQELARKSGRDYIDIPVSERSAINKEADRLLSEWQASDHASPLYGVLSHQQLRQAYPDTEDIVAMKQRGPAQGSYGGNELRYGGGLTDGSQRSTVIHELQHAIQQREGWAKGGSPEQMAVEKAKAKNDWDYWSNIAAIRQEAERNGGNIDKAAKEIGELFDFQPTLEHRMAALNTPLKTLQTKAEQAQSAMFPYSEHEAYRRLAGEAEARATQARMNMDMAQRRATFPLDSYDVPVNQLIIRGGLLK